MLSKSLRVCLFVCRAILDYGSLWDGIKWVFSFFRKCLFLACSHFLRCLFRFSSSFSLFSFLPFHFHSTTEAHTIKCMIDLRLFLHAIPLASLPSLALAWHLPPYITHISDTPKWHSPATPKTVQHVALVLFSKSRIGKSDSRRC